MLNDNPTLEFYLLQAKYIVKELHLAIRILYGPFKWFSYEIISYFVLHYVTFWL